MTRVLMAVVVLALTCAVLDAQRDGGVPPPDRLGRFRGSAAVAAVGTASIRGRVVAADTGAPLRRAQVRAQNGPSSRQTFTDENGRYELRGLPAGEWVLVAGKAGFVSLRYGQRRPSEPVPAVTLAERETKAAADFSLPRGGVFAGRITDEYGDPIAGVRVQALAYRAVRGLRQVSLVGMPALTDDTGSFRLYGLGPGQYYVSARADVAVESADGAAAYAPTYFPGTGNIGEAQRIRLAPGEEQPGVSFQLSLVRTVRVSGTVNDSAGAPLQGGVATLAAPFESSDASQLLGATTRIRTDGTFVFPNVVPGAYTLRAASLPGFRGQARAAVVPEMVSTDITVGREDVSGLALSTTTGGTVGGTVTTEAGAATRPSARLRIAAQALRPMPGFNARTADVTADGGFEIAGLVGPHWLRMDGLPDGWRVARIDANGIDVSDRPIDVKAGERLALTVSLTDKAPVVTGTVRRLKAPAAAYPVVVFPADPERWGFASRYIRTARTGDDGRFTVRGLPPFDRYLAAAVEYLDDGDALGPELLERLRRVAEPFALDATGTVSIEVPLVPREP